MAGDALEIKLKELLRDPRYGWVRITPEAWGLVEVDRMVAVVVKSESEPGVDESGEPIVAEAGYYLTDCERPRNTFLIAAPHTDWDEARLRAAAEFHARRLSGGDD